MLELLTQPKRKLYELTARKSLLNSSIPSFPPSTKTEATKSGPPLSPNNGLQGSPSTNNRSQGSPSPNNGSQGLLFDLANHRSEESSNYANIPALPAFSELAPPQFTWGEEDPEVFIHSISVAFDEVVHWRRNIFQYPVEMPAKALSVSYHISLEPMRKVPHWNPLL